MGTEREQHVYLFRVVSLAMQPNLNRTLSLLAYRIGERFGALKSRVYIRICIGRIMVVLVYRTEKNKTMEGKQKRVEPDSQQHGHQVQRQRLQIRKKM